MDFRSSRITLFSDYEGVLGLQVILYGLMDASPIFQRSTAVIVCHFKG